MESMAAALYFETLNGLKMTRRIPLTNNLYDSATLAELLASKPDARLFVSDAALLLLLPRHGQYDELLFHGAGIDSLRGLLGRYLESPDFIRPVSVRVSAKGPVLSDYDQLFTGLGLIAGKKLGRTCIRGWTGKNYRLAMSLADDRLKETRFAAPGEEGEILAILRATFDVMDEGVPELDEIREAINNKNVIVVDVDGRIGCVAYYSLENNIYRGLFDATLPAYRKDFIYLNTLKFFANYKKAANLVIKKSYGWRDLSKKRLVRFAKNLEQQLDGVCLYAYSLSPEGHRASSSGQPGAAGKSSC